MDQSKTPILSANHIYTNSEFSGAYPDEQHKTAINSSEVSPSQSRLKLTYFHSDRLEAFCDAVLSILATILMTPLKFSSEEMADNNLKELLTKSHNGFAFAVPQFLIQFLFFASVFFFIVSVWYRHMKIFYLYPVADNFTLWLTILFLLACSFLPLATTFLNIGTVPTVIALLFLSTSVIGLVQTIQILYGTCLRSSLSSQTETQPVGKVIIGFQIASYFFTPILLLVSLCFSFISGVGPTIASAIVYIMVFGGKTIVIFEAIYARYTLRRDPTDTFPLKLRNFNSAVSKSRVELFTDGVFAIVATIIILDSTSDLADSISADNFTNLPNMGKTENLWELNSLVNHFLYTTRFSIYSYVMCFLIVCLFWYVNHSIFHYIRRMSKLMTSVNMLSQLFVCLLPFCANILVGYGNRPGVHNLSLAITFTCVTLFIISILQIFLWLIVRFWTRDALTQDLKCATDLQMLLRLFLMPLVSFIFFFVNAFSDNVISLLCLFLFFAGIMPALILIEFLYFLFHLMTNKLKV